MPSAVQLAALRREIREAISAGLVDAPDARERLTARLDRVGETGGRPALTVLASLTLNGMLELQKARTGVQLGGIADFLRTSVDRFGQPQAAIGRGIVEAIRHGYSAGSLDAPESKKALDQVWASFGPESLGYGATLVRGHVKVPAGGHEKSPRVASGSPHLAFVVSAGS